MKIKDILTAYNILKGTYLVALILLIVISGIYYKHTQNITSSTEQVLHSYNVNIELNQLISVINDAETGQRGFLLTGDSVMLENYITAHEKLKLSFQRLNSLTKANLQQKNNLDSLQNLLNLRLTYLTRTLSDQSKSPLDKSVLLSNIKKGKLIMEVIHKQVNEMIYQEQIYLKEHQKKYENEISFTPFFTILLLVFSLLVFIFSYLKINNDLVKLKKANLKLVIASEAFKQAEKIGEFSSWQWDLHTNTLVLSDNHYRLLGCEPGSFDSNFDNFLDFVHPDDRHILIENRKKINHNKNIVSDLYRVIRKDGKIRYFKSISRVLIDLKRKKTIIGINSDITEQHLGKLLLEERNHELELSNKELANFNHLASHDLQEPLRKIQTYISRIKDSEFQKFSDTDQEYFNRIQFSVQRMRTLIDDLLQFSRSNKIEKNFEPTDLNLILEEARLELAQLYEDKKAILTHANLPTIMAIPFQIRQLFVNLISNSLKYSKLGIIPQIDITFENIDASNFPEIFKETNKKYVCITVTDNGIGFEPQYAENIFLLFTRLHDASAYPGSGIGLSICKKIIDNHKGHIIAKGYPGKGAEFNIYLPLT